MDDVMLDLETMGTGPNAAIISIGAVAFDIPSQTIGDRFYRMVELESSVNYGGVMTAATVLWWLKQSDSARAAFNGHSVTLPGALRDFATWLSPTSVHSDVRIWGNGAAFDNVILAEAYKRIHIPLPWHYRNDRCYRTVAALHPHVPLTRVGTHHNAADDAESQARHLLAMLGTPAPDLLAAARAVIARWDSPDWKDKTHTGDYIHALRVAVANAALSGCGPKDDQDCDGISPQSA